MMQKAAAVVAAFGNLQVGVMVGRQAYALGRHQVDKGIVQRGQVLVYRLHDLLQRMRPGHGQNLGVGAADHIIAGRILLGAEAAGDDDLAVFGQRLADGVERLLDCGIDEAAGVDHHEVGAVVAA
jgi:hypothetical protein